MEYNQLSLITSASDNSNYTDFCELAVSNDEVFFDFRRSAIYNCILEHFDYEFGQKCLDSVKLNSEELLDYFSIFQSSDLYGNPITFDYKKDGNFSASTLRYIANLSQIISAFGDLSGSNIVEIGGGYGGLCKIIQDRFQVNSYTVIDLPAVLKLTSKYLECFGNKYTEKLDLLTLDNLDACRKYDLIISNCAFTECVPPIQDMYLEKVIKNATKGFIIYNLRPESYHPVILLTKFERLNLKNFYSVKEAPITCETNFVLLWDNESQLKVTNSVRLPYFYARFIYKLSPFLYRYSVSIYRVIRSIFIS